MAYWRDPFYCNTHIDSNIANEIASEATAMHRIFKHADIGREPCLQLIVPYSVRAELKALGVPPEVAAVADNGIFTIPVELTAPERRRLSEFLDVTRGNAQPENIDADLKHVYEAEKYGGGYFLTLDKRLLQRRESIFNFLQVQLMTPTEFVAVIDKALELRRQRAAR